MTSNNAVDAARVELLLSELRLPAIKLMWAALATRADKEGWPAARFLAALAEHEIADRGRRRIERHLASARLPAARPRHLRLQRAHGQQGAGHGACRRHSWFDQVPISAFWAARRARGHLEGAGAWLSAEWPACAVPAPLTSCRGCGGRGS